MKKDKIVVLMATYNDWESVAELVPKIDNELVKNDLSGHIVIVDDGSTDVTGRTKLLDAQLSSINHIECLELYRNQGNQRANAVGIAYCNDTVVGDYLILMDSDQEDKPKYIPELIKACASYDDRQIVFAERSERSEGWQFKFFYAIYQKLYNILTGMKISIGNFSAIPYNKVNSSNFKFNFYLKSFKLKKDLIKIFIGLGLEKNKLNLGYNSLNILGDSLVFFNLNMFNIKRNNLKHHFLNIPINLSWMPFKKKNENFKTQIEFTNHFLWYGKTNFRYHDNDQVFNHSVKNDFFFEKYYLSGCFKIIWKNIGAYFQTNLTNYSTLFPNIYNYSYGLTLCL